jgi:hypothetical protein
LLANIVLLGTSLMRTKLEGYRIECNICPDAICLTHSEIPYIYEGRLVKILENISFLFYKEINMKYLILYYK